MKHLVPTELLNKVLAYLATKPFSEVNALIVEMQKNAVQFIEPKKEENIKEETTC